MGEKLKLSAGAALALGVLFGIPAVLVRVSMEDVPQRSMVKVVTVYDEAVDFVATAYAQHRGGNHDGRLMPLPDNSHDWIESINPLGRKAPGGGPAILPEANPETGAVGLTGDEHSVMVTLPAYRQLGEVRTVITAEAGVVGKGS